MPKLLSIELEAGVLALHSAGYSTRAIVSHYSRLGTSISQSAVSSIVRGKGKRRVSKAAGAQFVQHREKPVRTSRMVRKVRQLSTKENPLTQRAIAKELGCSQSAVFTAIHNDLDLQTRKKPRVHALTVLHMIKRRKRIKKLLAEFVREENIEFLVTLDESLLYLTECTGQREICYVDRGSQVPDEWARTRAERFGPKVMAIGILTGRAAVPLFFVPEKAKVNSDFYIDHVLRPLVEKFLPQLYPGELNRVWVHHDGATAHTSKKTTAFMEKVTESTGIRFIHKDDIPPKTPDGSPLDFFGFGFLKGKLRHRRAQTLGGLRRVARQEWSRIDSPMIENVFRSWIKRYKQILRARGKHIENVKQLHNKRVSQ